MFDRYSPLDDVIQISYEIVAAQNTMNTGAGVNQCDTRASHADEAMFNVQSTSPMFDTVRLYTKPRMTFWFDR